MALGLSFRLPNVWWNLDSFQLSCDELITKCLSVYLEDVIERTVMYIKFHLTAGVYPAYDPVYADPKGKGIF